MPSKGPEERHPVRFSPISRDMLEGCGQVAFVLALCTLIVAGLLDGLSKGAYHRAIYKEFFSDSAPKDPTAPTNPALPPHSPASQPEIPTRNQYEREKGIISGNEDFELFKPNKQVSPEEEIRIIRQAIKDIKQRKKANERNEGDR